MTSDRPFTLTLVIINNLIHVRSPHTTYRACCGAFASSQAYVNPAAEVTCLQCLVLQDLWQRTFGP